jgi:hypothetical protein
MQIRLRLHARVPIFTIVIKLEKVAFALRPDFLRFLSFGLDLPTLLRFDSDVDISYVQGKGLTGQGSAGGLPALGINFPTSLNLKIGGSGAGLNIDHVVTRLEAAPVPGGLRFRVQFRYGANAQFGPLKAVMDGAGVWFGRWTDGNGGLLPPQGIGLALAASPVDGGGFLKIISDNEFAGALQLKILGIGAFAYGIYKILPNGKPSFVALIGIRLPLPGIQLGYGFAVSGFGGLVGINRRADTDKRRCSLQRRSHAQCTQVTGRHATIFPRGRGCLSHRPYVADQLAPHINTGRGRLYRDRGRYVLHRRLSAPDHRFRGVCPRLSADGFYRRDRFREVADFL